MVESREIYLKRPLAYFPMKIIVGSTNPTKIEAVQEVVSDYSCLAGAEIVGISVPSGVSEQPKSLDEILHGAENRAKDAFRNCDYSIGIESGLNNYPCAGYMDTTACVIYDGEKFYYGFSASFSCPEEVTRLAVQEGLTLNDACYKAGLSTNPKIGSAEGIIGILTKGRIKRKDYTKDAIIMALIHIENKF